MTTHSTNRKPRVLISTGRRNEGAKAGEIQTVVIGCNSNYVNGVMRAGGAPLLVPRVADADAIAAMVEIADGLVLTGGGDVLSLEYGEEPHPKNIYQDSVRDMCELELVRLALARNLPILGICRGIQILNVALGGSLIQDIPSQVENAALHYADPLNAGAFHTVRVEAGTLLSKLVDESATLAVNTYHHQAVNRVGDGLRVNCLSTQDNVIEGVEAVDGRPILGIQWHPEEIAAEFPQQQAFFGWLVAQANAHRQA